MRASADDEDAVPDDELREMRSEEEEEEVESRSSCVRVAQGVNEGGAASQIEHMDSQEL